MTNKIRESFGYIDDHLESNCTTKKLDAKIIFNNSDVIPNTFKIMTYNIWGILRGIETNERLEFIKDTMKIRMDKISEIILEDDPDIVCLQEMTDASYEYLHKLKSKYKYCFEPDLNTKLNKHKRNRDVEVFIYSKYCPKKMKLYSINGNLGYNNCFMVLQFDNLVILNCYLQSGSKYSPGHNCNHNNVTKHYSRCRLQQMNIIEKQIKKYKIPIVMVGDFNMHLDGDVNEWTELGALQKCKLDDAWLKLKKNENGFTEDTNINQMRWNMKFVDKQVRFDGIFYKRLYPININLIGATPILLNQVMTEKFKKFFVHDYESNKDKIKYYKDNMVALYPSDHFGLTCVFRLKN